MPREQLEFPFKDLPRLTHFGFSDRVDISQFGPHKHYGYELIYVTRGEAGVRIFEGDDPIRLIKDDLYVIAPGEIHQFQYSQEDIDFFWLGFQTGEDVVLAEHHMTAPYSLLNKNKKFNSERVELIRQMDREIISIRDKIQIDKYHIFHKVPYFNRLFQDIDYELHHTDGFSTVMIYQKLIEIFTFIARLLQPGNLSSGCPIDYAYRYLKSHCREKIDFKELAEKTGYSGEHFSRAFKEKFGQSPRAFHEECRIAEARDFLTRGLSVQDTAYNCGFKSSSHFSTWFRKKQGLSPVQYYSN